MDKKRLIRLVNGVFLAAALVFFLGYLIAQRGEIGRIASRADGVLLSGAFTALTVYQFVQAGVIASLLRSFGGRVKLVETVRIVLLSLLGKYVPGKIWIFTMRAGFFAERNVSVRTVVTAAGMEHLFVIVTALALYLLASPPGEGGTATLCRAGGVLMLGALVFAPGPVVAAANALYRRLGRHPLEETIQRRRSALFAAAFLLTWILLGSAVWFLVRSIGGPIPLTALPALSGGYALSVVAGFAAFFAPGGVGVREAVFAAALARYVPPVDAVLLALGVRLFTSLAEIAALGLIHLVPAAVTRGKER